MNTHHRFRPLVYLCALFGVLLAAPPALTAQAAQADAAATALDELARDTERAEAIRAREDRLPEAYAMCRARGWSLLTRAGQEVAAEIEMLEGRFATKLSDAAKALESVAGVLDEAEDLERQDRQHARRDVEDHAADEGHQEDDRKRKRRAAGRRRTGGGLNGGR